MVAELHDLTGSSTCKGLGSSNSSSGSSSGSNLANGWLLRFCANGNEGGNEG